MNEKSGYGCPICNDDESCPGEHLLLDIANASDECLAENGLARLAEVERLRAANKGQALALKGTQRARDRLQRLRKRLESYRREYLDCDYEDERRSTRIRFIQDVVGLIEDDDVGLIEGDDGV